jgi:opacity protein-like surface antigen
MSRLIGAILVLLILAPLAASAQSATGAPAPSENEFAIWGARSFANGHAFGFIQDRSLWRFDFRYGRLLWSDYGIALRYVLTAVPVALVGEPGGSHIYGGGLSPVGAQMNFATRHRIQPFLASNGGFLYFTEPAPTPAGTQFNFTVFIAAGAQVFTSSSRSLEFGYQYHHFSNANISLHNPALDNHMIFLGVSFLR